MPGLSIQRGCEHLAELVHPESQLRGNLAARRQASNVSRSVERLPVQLNLFEPRAHESFKLPGIVLTDVEAIERTVSQGPPGIHDQPVRCGANEEPSRPHDTSSFVQAGSVIAHVLHGFQAHVRVEGVIGKGKVRHVRRCGEHRISGEGEGVELRVRGYDHGCAALEEYAGAVAGSGGCVEYPEPRQESRRKAVPCKVLPKDPGRCPPGGADSLLHDHAEQLGAPRRRVSNGVTHSARRTAWLFAGAACIAETLRIVR